MNYQFLTYLNVNVISDEVCKILLTNIGSSEWYFTSSICVMANVVNYENLFCSGMSMGGEPLTTSSSRVMFGIKSITLNCDDKTPFIFTGVSHFAEWIAENTNAIGVDVM